MRPETGNSAVSRQNCMRCSLTSFEASKRSEEVSSSPASLLQATAASYGATVMTPTPASLISRTQDPLSRPSLLTTPHESPPANSKRFGRFAMAGAFTNILLLLLLLVAVAQLGLTAFLISYFDEKGWPGQRQSGPLVVKALWVQHLFHGPRDLTYSASGPLVYSPSSLILRGLCWARYCSSHSVRRTRCLLEGPAWGG